MVFLKNYTIQQNLKIEILIFRNKKNKKNMRFRLNNLNRKFLLCFYRRLHELYIL